MSGPAVSVIVPCFNLGQYLDEAVASVLAQSFQDFEIIVVNDGSTDPNTARVLANFDRPKTRVVTIEHQGLARARNTGITMAAGRYICALDADDRLAPTYLDKAVQMLEQYPDLAFVSCWLETFGEESWLWKPERCDLPTLLAECTVCTAALVRRSAVVAVGCYDERMPAQGYEDWDLWLSLVSRGFTGKILPEVLFYYRRRLGSMSTVCTVGDAHLKLIRYLVDKHATSYDQHLAEVLARKDRDLGEQLRANDSLERYIETSLKLELQRRHEELALLQRKLASAREQRALRDEHSRLAEKVDHLSSSLEMARREIAELRNSKSWKVTLPLRTAYGLIRRPPPKADGEA
jgi:glycosyltransferase involved in cell wall biosynthesis